MNSNIKEIKGVNFNIDLTSQGNVDWIQADCPWNVDDGGKIHNCAVDDNICPHFKGVKYLDSIFCTYENNTIKELKGGNIGMVLKDIRIKCAWNKAEKTDKHICGVKDTSLCKYFCGIRSSDGVLCSYPHENITVLAPEDFTGNLAICPSCGRQHDADYDKCPFCNYTY